MPRVPIVDLSEVLLKLGLSSSVTDEEEALVAQAVIEAEGAVKKYLRYDPTKQERTELYPQFDVSREGREAVWESDSQVAYQRYLSQASTDELQLRHIPVRSISALYIDYDSRGGKASGAFGSESLKTEGTDYWGNYDMQDSDGNL